jgi:hypothetical protein
MRRAAKIDQNQPEIVEALRAAGHYVQSTAMMGRGFPDLLAVKKSGLPVLLEVKMPGERLTPDELKWHRAFPGPVFVVCSIEEALEVMG